MTNIEKNDNLQLNIEWKLSNLSDKLPSINEERLADICKNIPKEDLNKQCINLNNIFTQELWKIGLNFYSALNKKENPKGVSYF